MHRRTIGRHRRTGAGPTLHAALTLLGSAAFTGGLLGGLLG